MPVRASARTFRLPACLSAALLLSGNALAHPVVPRPAFAQPAAFDAGARPDSSHGNQGCFFLLSEEAVDIPTESQYRHTVSKALSESGLEEVASISVAYDTAYQRVDFHRITLWRGGKPREILPGIRPSVLRRESDLEAGMLDGTRTLHFNLEDVRVGDIVESEYTVRGFNPVFGAKASGSSLLRYGVPVDRIRVRLLQHPDHPLHVVRRSGAGPYLSEAGDGRRIFTWDLSKVAPLPTDSDAPAWHDPFARIQWSEYGNWGEVVAWALPLYQFPGDAMPPPLRKLADSLRTLDPRAAVRVALRMVQNDIRYLGLEMGTSSHRPAPPSVTYGRRFGDCKDKTVLLCALLKRAGIEAVPVLVNTWARRGVAEYNPSPTAFNHVIARVKVPAGPFLHHFVDPTLTGQRGDPIENQHLNYGKGLPVEAGAYDFEDIEVRHPERSRMDVRSIFDVEDVNRPAALSMVTTYSGAEADAIRPYLAETGREELAKQYLNYLSRQYPRARGKAPVAWEDDSAGNVITVREEYAVDSLCAPDESGRLACSFLPQEVSNFVSIPERNLRTSPYALAYPKNVSQDIEIRMRESFSNPRDKDGVRHPAFTFDWDERLSGRTLNMHYAYSSSDDHVALEKFPAYVRSLERVWENLGVTLYPDAAGIPDAGHVNWLLVFYSAFSLAVGAWASRRYLMRKAPAPILPAAALPRPIGGALIVMAIGVAISPFVLLYQLKDLLGMFNLGNWNALTSPGSETFHPAWMPILLFEILANGISLSGSFSLWFLFFRRDRAFPRAYIALSLYGIGIIALDGAAVLLLPESAREEGDLGGTVNDLSRALFWSGVWIAYLLKSSRVRETFVSPLPEPLAPAPGAISGLQKDTTSP